MVHKVTMDTVRIITSSVSGMTNVSEPMPHALARTLELVAHVCAAPRSGERCMPRILHCCCPHSPSLGGLGALISQLPELLSFKIQFQSQVLDGNSGPPDARAVPGTQ